MPYIKSITASIALFVTLNVQGASFEDYIVEQGKKAESNAFLVEDVLGNPTLESAAQSGDIRAQFELGMIKFSYDGQSGIQWIEKAAAQGHVEAQYLMGSIYLEGKATQRDIKKSFNYFDSCSKLGNKKCDFYIGQFYENGFGIVQPNDDLAKWFYENAAYSGDKRAIEHLCKNDKSACKYKSSK